MSWYDYRDLQYLTAPLSRADPSFVALLWALWRKADSENRLKLRAVFGDEIDEYQRRYDAIAGILSDDPPAIKLRLEMENPFGTR